MRLGDLRDGGEGRRRRKSGRVEKDDEEEKIL